MVTAALADRSPQQPIVIGYLTLDMERRAASHQDQPLALTSTEFDILVSLARDCGRIKTREQLLLEAADRDFEAFDRSIDMHISSLRRKLGDDPKSPRYIVTVRSAGYMLQNPAEESQT